MVASGKAPSQNCSCVPIISTLHEPKAYINKGAAFGFCSQPIFQVTVGLALDWPCDTRQYWYYHLRAHGLRKGDEHPAYTLAGMGPLYLYLLFFRRSFWVRPGAAKVRHPSCRPTKSVKALKDNINGRPQRTHMKPALKQHLHRQQLMSNLVPEAAEALLPLDCSLSSSSLGSSCWTGSNAACFGHALPRTGLATIHTAFHFYRYYYYYHYWWPGTGLAVLCNYYKTGFWPSYCQS